MLTWLVVTQGALAGDTTLAWDLTVKGVNVGSRELTVRTMDGADGQSRILESFTDINGMVGPLKVRWRQRMTAHVDAREPAAFTSVVDQNGSLLEIQGRWTPTGWQITSTTNGRSRSTDMPLSRVDLSTADLMDPGSRYPLSHYDEVRVLSAESGEVMVGPVEKLGVSEVTIDGQAIQVTGYAWTSPQGRSELMFSADGWLVKYSQQLLGIQVDAVLRDPPPGGSDDFPVAVRPPKVEALDL
ncbi:MAG: hypothetical protein H6735_15290 [Alphaproteobacteria bacterium]|nr:hypothetical protein [Alphaproteobacteria bacterium]